MYTLYMRLITPGKLYPVTFVLVVQLECGSYFVVVLLTTELGEKA
jgi:hypothetical protein